jgi:hypothetical protein
MSGPDLLSQAVTGRKRQLSPLTQNAALRRPPSLPDWLGTHVVGSVIGSQIREAKFINYYKNVLIVTFHIKIERYFKLLKFNFDIPKSIVNM